MSETLPIKKSESIFDVLQAMQDRIMRRAYEIFEANGQMGGEMDNWLAAERELIRKPSMELREKDNQFMLDIEMPGVTAKDLKIEVTPEELLVSAETREETNNEKDKLYTSELKTGSLFRSIAFPKRVNADNVKAELKDGILKITAPIAEEHLIKRVDIKAA